MRYVPSLFWQKRGTSYETYQRLASKAPPTSGYFFAHARYALHRLGLKADKHDIENYLAVRFLREEGLYNAYESMRKMLGIHSSLDFARYFYYASLLQAYLPGPVHVLEIGGGEGMMARVLDRMGLVKTYLNIEIPEVVEFSRLTLGARVISDMASAGETKFSVAPITFTGDPPKNFFGLALNTYSFMEMDNETVTNYMEFIAASATRPGLLLTVNRYRRRLPTAKGLIDTNPLLYAYPKGAVLRWEAEVMQETVRVNSAPRLYTPYRNSTAFIRIQRIE